MSDYERWYAIALDGNDCFGKDKDDFFELCDLVAALGDLPDPVRDAMRNRRFLKTEVFRAPSGSMKATWFSSLLERAHRELIELESIDGLEVLLCTDRVIHLSASIRHLRLLSQKAYVAHVRRHLTLLDMANRCEQRSNIDERWVEIAALVFLQKHLTSDWWERHEDSDPE